MDLIVDRASLQSALNLVQGIVERRNTVPILGHVLLEPEETGLRLSATDLEVGIRTEVACRTTEKGTITLNARKLFEVVREGAGEEVEMRSLEGDWIEVKCGRAKFKMMGLDPRSFPAMPGHSEREGTLVKHKPAKGALKLGAAVLATMIDRTIFAVSPD
jgi:DNA polymerase-3 subunit beta